MIQQQSFKWSLQFLYHFILPETKTEDDKDQYQGYIRELKAINERRGRIMIQVNEQGHK